MPAPGRAIGLVAVYAVAVAGLLACTPDSSVGANKPDTTAGAAPTSAAPSTTKAPATTTTAARGPTGSGNPVTFAFAGDVNFEGTIGARLAADPATVLREVQPALSAADFSMVNLETAVAVGGTPQPKEFTFEAPPSALDALRGAGIDVATEANNH